MLPPEADNVLVEYAGDQSEWMDAYERLFGVCGSVGEFVGNLQGEVLNMVNRAVEEEREACAQIADGVADKAAEQELVLQERTADAIAHAIRKRGEGIAVA